MWIPYSSPPWPRPCSSTSSCLQGCGLSYGRIAVTSVGGSHAAAGVKRLAALAPLAGTVTGGAAVLLHRASATYADVVPVGPNTS